jgi:hypothetical protein
VILGTGHEKLSLIALGIEQTTVFGFQLSDAATSAQSDHEHENQQHNPPPKMESTNISLRPMPNILALHVNR